MAVPAEQVQELYRAIICWNKICRSDEVRYQLRLEPGHLLLLDNFRMAHGRAAIKDTRETGRCLRGGYLSWNDALSRIRYLHGKLLGTDRFEADDYKPTGRLPYNFKNVGLA